MLNFVSFSDLVPHHVFIARRRWSDEHGIEMLNFFRDPDNKKTRAAEQIRCAIKYSKDTISRFDREGVLYNKLFLLSIGFIRIVISYFIQ